VAKLCDLKAQSQHDEKLNDDPRTRTTEDKSPLEDDPSTIEAKPPYPAGDFEIQDPHGEIVGTRMTGLAILVCFVALIKVKEVGILSQAEAMKDTDTKMKDCGKKKASSANAYFQHAVVVCEW